MKEWLINNAKDTKIFVTDMWNTIKGLYQNVIIVADKYHILRKSDWMLRDIRINLFNLNDKYKKKKRLEQQFKP